MAVLALASATAGAAQSSATHPFPVIEGRLVPTAESGNPPGFSSQSLLMRAGGGEPGQIVLTPALGVLGLGTHEVSWTSESISGATYRFVRDATLTLSLGPIDVAAVQSLTVGLHALDPSGDATLLGAATRTFNLPRLLPADEQFQIPVAGSVLPRGAAVLLTLRAEALDVLTIVEYGTGTETALDLSYQVLDVDGDGIPDDGDPCPLEADCDGDGEVDGSAPGNGTGGQTVYNTYLNYYNSTPGTGAPGTAGAPGSPGGPGTLPPLPDVQAPGRAGDDGTSSDALRSRAALGRIEATAGGLALATGSTVTTLALLRRRP